MTAPRPWTGWSRSRSGASPSPRRRPPPSGSAPRTASRPTDAEAPLQHHRHPRPRRLHHRGRALARRARRRGMRARRQRRRGAADRDRLAAGRPLQGAAHRLRQQDGQDRRRLLQLRADDQGPDRRDALPDPAADRRRRPRFERPRRPHHHGRVDLERRGSRARPGPASRCATSSRTRPTRCARPWSSSPSRWTTTRWRPTSTATEPDVATLRKLIRKGTLAMKFVPVICGSAFKNKGVQPMLNAVIDFLPTPARRAGLHGLRAGRRDRDPQHRALGRRRASRSPASPSRS